MTKGVCISSQPATKTLSQSQWLKVLISQNSGSKPLAGNKVFVKLIETADVHTRRAVMESGWGGQDGRMQVSNSGILQQTFSFLNTHREILFSLSSERHIPFFFVCA